MKFSESRVDDAVLEWLSGLSYAVMHGPDISPKGPAPERARFSQILLTKRLRETLERLSPHLAAETLEEALRKLVNGEIRSRSRVNVVQAGPFPTGWRKQ